MKNILILIFGVVAGCGGCLGAAFGPAPEEDDPEVLILQTGPMVPPSSSVVVPAPSSKITRPSPHDRSR